MAWGLSGAQEERTRTPSSSVSRWDVVCRLPLPIARSVNAPTPPPPPGETENTCAVFLRDVQLLFQHGSSSMRGQSERLVARRWPSVRLLTPRLAAQLALLAPALAVAHWAKAALER